MGAGRVIVVDHLEYRLDSVVVVGPWIAAGALGVRAVRRARRR